MPELNFHTYGPADGHEILAIHGMTGHGARWADLAENHLSDARVLAPDLIGHGRSPWTPPWDIAAQVEGLRTLLQAHARGPVVVVGHSYGGAIAVHLARQHPELVRSLVLLDPAIDLDPEDLLEVAELTAKFPDYTDAAEAKSEKLNGAWADVPTELLDREVEEHLIPVESNPASTVSTSNKPKSNKSASKRRVKWRMSTAAIVASWGELAQPAVVPPSNVRTVVVQAMRVQPPYVSEKFVSALSEQLGANFRHVEMDCDHMVPQAKPAEVAALVRELL